MKKTLATLGVALWLAPAGHATTTRVLYTSNWSGHTEVYSLGPSSNRPLKQITHFGGACSEPPPFVPLALYASPNGRYLAVSCGAGLWLMRSNGREARELAPAGDLRGGPAIRVRWTQDSKLLGYERNNEVRVVEPATGRAHPATGRDLSRLRWLERGLVSPDGRWAAHIGKYQSDVVELRTGLRLSLPPALDARWSPNSRRLALESADGIRLFDRRTQRLRRIVADVGFGTLHDYDEPIPLGLSWSPDGRRIAYATGRDVYASATWGITTGDLRVVTLTGHVSTLVSAASNYGSQIKGVAWVTAGTPAAKLDPQSSSVLAGGRIDLLAADGNRVAFKACDTIFVWTPGTAAVEPSLSPNACAISETTGRYYIYDLALAGDRLLYGLNIGCNSITVSLNLRVLAPSGGGGQIARSFGNCGAPFGTALGRAAGAGDLLVFSEWSEKYAPSFPFPVTSASVRRLDGSSCPCPVIASTPGALYPADVDEGRLLVYGDNETIVLDRNGKRLLSLPVSPQAAQLSHDDLVLLTHGELRDYNVRDGELLHTWRLPDVSAGPVCGWRLCEKTRLVLGDVGRGRAAYILDGQLHLLRLADGADVVLRAASLARFGSDGLFQADGARLRFTAYTQLPLSTP